MGIDLQSRWDLEDPHEKRQKYQVGFKFLNCGLAIILGSLLLCSSSHASKITELVLLKEDPLLHVNRTITTEYLQVSEIFDNYLSIPDLILFSGIGLDEISKQSNGEVSASTSSNHISAGLQSISDQFIILEEASNFWAICNGTTRPVHWFHFQDVQKGLMKRVRSRGKYSRALGEFIVEEKSKEHEDVLFKEIGQGENNVILPTCITSSRPGDNTKFLAHVWRKLTRMHPDRKVTVFDIAQFVNKSKQINSTENEEATEIVLRNELGINGNERVELLLDGFQELESSNDLQISLDILEILKSEWKSTRVWVTTSSRYLGELEKVLGVACQELELVNEQDQIGFLVSFWSRNPTQKLDNGRLHQFANESLKNVNFPQGPSSKLVNIFDKSVLTPMLAEVYEDEAIEYAGRDFNNETNSHLIVLRYVEVNSNGIGALYKNWTSIKFKQYLNYANFDAGNNIPLNEEELMKMHSRLSLDYRFPGQFENIKETLGNVRMEEIAKVGIVHVSEYPNSSIFMEDAVADYFIARFLLNQHRTNDRDGVHWMGREWVDFVLQGPLSTQPMDVHSPSNCDSYCQSISSFTFKFPGISYFLEELLEDTSMFYDKSGLNSTNYGREIAHACVSSNSHKIFAQFDQLGAFDNSSSLIFDHELFKVAIMSSSLDFVKLVLSEFKKYHNYEESMDHEILFKGVNRGDFHIMEHLLRDPQLLEPIHGAIAKYIFLECLQNSKDDSDEVINGKVGIIGLLAGINRKLLNKKVRYTRSPLHARDIHVRLQVELIHLGANVFALNRRNHRKALTILHVDSESYLSAEDYHSLLMSIPEEKLKVLLELTNEDDWKPLPTLLSHLDPIPETFARFKEVDAEIEFDRDEYSGGILDRTDCSILGLAMAQGRSLATIKKLVEYGANLTVEDGLHDTLLHLAAKKGMLSTAKFLFGTGLFDVNAKNGYSWTPLDYVIQDHRSYYKTGTFLHSLGGTFQFEEGLQRLRSAINYNDLAKVKLMINVGMDVNGLFDNGNTPLHEAVDKYLSLYRGEYFFLVPKLLRDHGANPNLTNIHGMNPLQVALEKSRESGDLLDFETVQVLRDGMEVMWTPSLATLALVHLVAKGNVVGFDQLATEYISYGGDLDFKEGKKGKTLLNLAINRGNERAVKFLIENGADVNSGDKPILEVTSGTPLEIIRLLVDNGADVHTSSSYDNYTFLHHCIVGSYREPVPSSSQFHSLAEYLIGKNMSQLFNVKGGRVGEEVTPFEYVQRHMRIFHKTLILLKANGVPEEQFSGDVYNGNGQ